MSTNEAVYLQLLRDVINHGEKRHNRTGVDTLSLFGATCRYDLREGFPLLTTKKVHWSAAFLEMLWFISGNPDVRFLHQHDVSIWDEWVKDDGTIGPGYGYQWRHWQGYGGQEHDQLAQLVKGLKEDPYGRRHLVSAWNVEDLDKMALPPCHYAFQCYVSKDGYLDLMMHQRSADLFLGVPFNIAGYSLLLMMLAQCTGLSPRFFIHTLGDYHLYENHLDQVKTQLSRGMRELPKVYLRPDVTDLDAFRPEHIMVKSYDPWPAIKAPVAV